MKNFKTVAVLLTAVVLAAAPVAVAQEDTGRRLVPYQNDVTDPCPTYDSCTMSNYYYSTGTYEVTACKQSSCRTCDNINRCRTVFLADYCTCDNVFVGPAPNITACQNMSGYCVIH